MTRSRRHIGLLFIIYPVCVIFAALSILPFWLMIVNATRSTAQIQKTTLSLIPSYHFIDNAKILMKKAFNPMIGFMNSAIISVGATLCATYFSSLTAYALVIYDWRLKNAFFAMILTVMMIPAQVSTIGFYQFVHRLGLMNNYLPLIVPAIASPTIVFFMRQYLVASLHPDLVASARIDGSPEFSTFNKIVIPLMKPAIATQAIFVFVGTWNNFFVPLILLTNKNRYTMPIMVSLLRGDIYRQEYGSIYLALTLSVLPLFVIYFFLSKYIIAGVALGGIKE